jgi:hypothetical protein
VADTLNNLGDSYRSLGYAQKSRELLERALVINERHYGPDHSNINKILKSKKAVHVDTHNARKGESLCCLC